MEIPDPIIDKALERETLRLFRRFTIEIIENLGLCPWAAGARLRGFVREAVDLASQPLVSRSVSLLQEMGADETCEVGFCVFPRFQCSAQEFTQHVSAVRDAYGREPGPHGPLMAIVAFHPGLRGGSGSAQGLVDMLRRSPDPTIQAIRLSSLQSLRSDEPSTARYMSGLADLKKLTSNQARRNLHERVAEANLETVQQLGVDQLEGMLHDIQADRERTYLRLYTSSPAGE